MASDESERDSDRETAESDVSPTVPDPSAGSGPVAAILGAGSEGASPGPDPPTPPSTADVDVPRDLQASFWVLVVVANAAIMVLAVGAMFAVILGDWRLGGQLLAVGVALSAYGYYRYRGVAARKEALAAQAGEENDPGETKSGDRDSGSSGNSETDGVSSARVAETGGSDTDGESDARDSETDGKTSTPVPEGGVSDAVRQVTTAVHDDRSLEVLVVIVDHQPVGVRRLLADHDLCESDLHGTLAEFQAAGLIEETEVAGERGYRATGTAAQGVAVLREDE